MTILRDDADFDLAHKAYNFGGCKLPLYPLVVLTKSLNNFLRLDVTDRTRVKPPTSNRNHSRMRRIPKTIIPSHPPTSIEQLQVREQLQQLREQEEHAAQECSTQNDWRQQHRTERRFRQAA